MRNHDWGLLIVKFWLVITLSPLSVWAESSSEARPTYQGILLAPPTTTQLAIYERPISSLSRNEKMRIKIHGLRLAPLHPLVWGTLARERTDNRNLVPIKRFFLRDSTDPNFRLSELTVNFHFKPVDPRYMAQMPHQKDPVFEIGFGGRFSEKSISDPPIEDTANILRLSAFPRLRSGFFCRKHERYSELSQSSPALVEVKQSYQLKLKVNSNSASAFLNGELFSEIQGAELDHGLVSLQTSWHPVLVDSLSISGAVVRSGKRESISLSGLISKENDG